MSTVLQRRLPRGAEPVDEGVHFRVWAPRRKQVDVVIEGLRAIALERESNGYFSADSGICQREHDLPIPAGWWRSAPSGSCISISARRTARPLANRQLQVLPLAR